MKRVWRVLSLSFVGVLAGVLPSILINNIVQAKPGVVASQVTSERTSAAAISTDFKGSLSQKQIDLFELANKARRDNGQKQFKINFALSESASYKAEDMTARHYFGHNDPVDDSLNGLDRAIKNTHDRCEVVSENLYQGQVHNSPDAAVQAWLNSPSHRAALLNPANVELGVGVSGDNYVLHFCSFSN